MTEPTKVLWGAPWRIECQRVHLFFWFGFSLISVLLENVKREEKGFLGCWYQQKKRRRKNREMDLFGRVNGDAMEIVRDRDG